MNVAWLVPVSLLLAGCTSCTFKMTVAGPTTGYEALVPEPPADIQHIGKKARIIWNFESLDRFRRGYQKQEEPPATGSYSPYEWQAGLNSAVMMAILRVMERTFDVVELVYKSAKPGDVARLKDLAPRSTPETQPDYSFTFTFQRVTARSGYSQGWLEDTIPSTVDVSFALALEDVSGERPRALRHEFRSFWQKTAAACHVLPATEAAMAMVLREVQRDLVTTIRELPLTSSN